MNRTTLSTVAVGIAVALAAAALVVALVVDKAPAPTVPTSSVKVELEHLRSEVVSLRQEATAQNAATAKLKGTVGKISTCLPEIMTAIAGLTPEVTEGKVFLTQHQQISNYCSSTLNNVGP